MSMRKQLTLPLIPRALSIMSIVAIATGTVCLLLYVCVALVFLWHSWQALSFPFPLDYGEGHLLYEAIRIAHFQTIYPATLAQPPYVLDPYPPLFVLFQVPFVWLGAPALWYGRL